MSAKSIVHPLSLTVSFYNQRLVAHGTTARIATCIVSLNATQLAIDSKNKHSKTFQKSAILICKC